MNINFFQLIRLTYLMTIGQWVAKSILQLVAFILISVTTYLVCSYLWSRGEQTNSKKSQTTIYYNQENECFIIFNTASGITLCIHKSFVELIQISDPNLDGCHVTISFCIFLNCQKLNLFVDAETYSYLKKVMSNEES